MQAVLLAAGKGTRLLPLTQTVPKGMVEIEGKPLLQIQIEQLKSVGITDIVVVIHYLKEKIMEYFGSGDRFGVKMTYVHQKTLAGAGNAVICTEPLITSERFFVIACDNFFPTDHLKRMLAHTSPGVVTVRNVEDTTNRTAVVVNGRHVQKIMEKPGRILSPYANSSIYLFPKTIFAACSAMQLNSDGEYYIIDAIQKLIDSGTHFEFEINNTVLDIGTHETLEKTREMASKFSGSLL